MLKNTGIYPTQSETVDFRKDMGNDDEKTKKKYLRQQSDNKRDRQQSSMQKETKK